MIIIHGIIVKHFDIYLYNQCSISSDVQRINDCILWLGIMDVHTRIIIFLYCKLLSVQYLFSYSWWPSLVCCN